MNKYVPADKGNWEGRASHAQLYLHEKIKLESLTSLKTLKGQKKIALLGYACDEGVRRNQGRVGASKGPDALRKQLGKLPNHLPDETILLDAGNLHDIDADVAQIHQSVIDSVGKLLNANVFPIILGGGHDLAYAHYSALKASIGPEKTLGIINFDAHFDLRSDVDGTTSGTPFLQIANDLKKEGKPLKYFCAGIRRDANDVELFRTADALGVIYLERPNFTMNYLEHVQLHIMQFLEDVDYIYTTVDIDGFSSAYAPGVSAASPMGFSPDIVLESLKLILESRKLIGLDVVELNPEFDRDHQTAKLAASLVHFVIHAI